MKTQKLVFSGMTLLLVFSSMFIVGCDEKTLSPTPAPADESEIPVNITTYTSEGLFEISYPHGWAPATSLIGEIEEEMKEWIMNIDPEAEVEDSRILFIAGLSDEEGYYPSVSISVATRSIGYYSLNEIVESETLWNREYLQKYKVHKQTRTIVDGREAEIIIDEDYTPEDGVWYYIDLYMVKDGFVWFVECGCEAEDYNNYEDIFTSVVRSVRILN